METILLLLLLLLLLPHIVGIDIHSPTHSPTLPTHPLVPLYSILFYSTLFCSTPLHSTIVILLSAILSCYSFLLFFLFVTILISQLLFLFLAL
ncbi:hypothetical protein GQ42DRAFT_77554 [Ramicandelaber brevisporus]|nr:hypothetical protein GQ42DRAFT_77554 [Ramicandelaber brevisporus]